MVKVMRHTLGASLNIRHNLSSSKGKVKMSTVESIARPRRNGERRRAPTASISKESPAITGVVEMVIRSEERRVGKECRCVWWPDHRHKHQAQDRKRKRKPRHRPERNTR